MAQADKKYLTNMDAEIFKVKDQIKEIKEAATYDKGFISDMVGNMRTENTNLQNVLTEMSTDMIAKTEKIAWFERKLNKWVMLFEDS